jgi:hypothetical protein
MGSGAGLNNLPLYSRKLLKTEATERLRDRVAWRSEAFVCWFNCL